MTASFVDVIDRRRAWQGHPGLWDPSVVVENCVTNLNKDVYANIGWYKIDIERDRPPSFLRELCPGVERYLHPIGPCEPEVIEKVMEYIAYPCHNKLRVYVHKSKEISLQFLKEYLRIRGPFLNVRVDQGSLERAEFSFRYMVNAVTYHLKRLPTLDFCAALILGRYLHHLTTVAYTHRLYFFRDLISRHYAPTFLKFHVKGNLKEELDPARVNRTAVALFASIIETLPWDQLQPMESVSLCVFPSSDRHLQRSNDEVGDFLQKCRKIPEDILKDLEPYFEDMEKEMDDEAKAEMEELVNPEKKAFETDKPFHPDKCNLVDDSRVTLA